MRELSKLRICGSAGGFVELFPVQAAAWQVTAGGHSAAHDLCISAPTGSGKTLAYALPILQGLLGCASLTPLHLIAPMNIHAFRCVEGFLVHRLVG